MSKKDKHKPSGKKKQRRLWGVDAIALGFLGVSALLVQASLGASGAAQGWAVFVAAAAAAAGLGLLVRYMPARQVVMLTCAMVVVVEAVLVAGVTQTQFALADLASPWSSGGATPSVAALARLGVAGLFLVYLARPRTARAFRR